MAWTSIFEEYCTGCVEIVAGILRFILIIFCGITIVFEIISIFSIDENFGMVLISMFLVLVATFGIVGAYTRNYKLLIIFGSASLVFGTVLVIFHHEKTRDDLRKDKEDKMVGFARDYNFTLLLNSTDRKEANIEWDRWQTANKCCGSAGPGDWISKWARAGPPRSCCESEQKVNSTTNVCQAPYEKGCSDKYLAGVESGPDSRRFIHILSLISGVIALFLAFVYYMEDMRIDTERVGQPNNNFAAKMVAPSPVQPMVKQPQLNQPQLYQPQMNPTQMNQPQMNQPQMNQMQMNQVPQALLPQANGEVQKRPLAEGKLPSEVAKQLQPRDKPATFSLETARAGM